MRFTVVAFLIAPWLLAQAPGVNAQLFPKADRVSRSEGALVRVPEAIVYAHSDTEEVEAKLPKGTPVAGYTSGFPYPRWTFDLVNGRVHVMYPKPSSGLRTAWMDPKDLENFTFSGGCQDGGSPIEVKGFSQRWNACFREGMALATAQLNALAEREGAASFKPPEVKQEATFKAGKAEAWDAVLEAVSDRGWGIKATDRESGLLTTEPAAAKPGAFLCGLSPEGAPTIALTIYVRPKGEETRVRVVSLVNGTKDGRALVCGSSGVVERELLQPVAKALGASDPYAVDLDTWVPPKPIEEPTPSAGQ